MSIPLHIRVPAWVKETSFTLNVNGHDELKILKDVDGYVVINRKWKNNDVIELQIPSTLHSSPMPDNPSRQAFFYGPVLLAGNLGSQEPDPMNGIPVFVTADTDINQWIKKKEDEPLTFSATAGVPQKVKLQPFYSIQNDHYSVYWDLFTPDQWAEQQKIYEAKRKTEFELEKNTVDVLRVGEMQPERDHNFTGEKTETGELHTRKFRVSNHGGSFSFTMKVASGFSHNLIGTYWGMDNRGRMFDIVVDGETIATENLNNFKESKFYDIEYRIPAHLTEGKTFVVIKFKAKPGNQAGPVYGVRIIKESKTEN